MSRELLPLLAFLWLLMLLGVGLGAYWFGWWWRGQHEMKVKAELVARMRRDWERKQRDEAHDERPSGPPQLRVVE